MHLAYPANPAIDQSGIRTRDRHVASTAYLNAATSCPGLRLLIQLRFHSSQNFSITVFYHSAMFIVVLEMKRVGVFFFSCEDYHSGYGKG